MASMSGSSFNDKVKAMAAADYSGPALRAVAERPGGPEVLTLRRVPTPVPGRGQVAIAVEAAGVAAGDVMARQGILPGRFPYTPGYDAVGHVVAVGDGVADLGVGQRVAAYTGTGGNATMAIAGAALCVLVPEDLPAERLSALVLNYTTAWQLLHRATSIPAGGSVLVLGAAGGVGSALSELALAEGLTVYGTAAASRRHDLVSGVIPIADASEVPSQVDAVFDGVGGPSLTRSRRATKRSGTVVSFGVLGASADGSGKIRAIGGLLLRLVRARTTPGARVVSYAISNTTKKDPAAFRADLSHLVDLLREGALDPRVTTMPLSDVAEAHRRLQAREVVGKLVLVP